MPVAVITGGSSGIGLALARRLRADGWTCVLLARGRERLEAAAHEIGAEAEVCDVGEEEAVRAVAARVLERHPTIDLLVNNAGIPGRTGFLGPAPERVETVLQVNYLGAVRCTRAFLPGLRGSTNSRIVNVVSIAGLVVAPGSGPYAAAKHAQLAFSRALTAELAPLGIRVHTINPGLIETEGFPQRERLPRPIAALVVEPDVVARAILGAIRRNRSERVVPRWYRIAAITQVLFPNTVSRFLARRQRPH